MTRKKVLMPSFMSRMTSSIGEVKGASALAASYVATLARRSQNALAMAASPKLLVSALSSAGEQKVERLEAPDIVATAV